MHYILVISIPVAYLQFVMHYSAI